jgi:DNA-binding MarR family transcriptional regulator
MDKNNGNFLIPALERATHAVGLWIDRAFRNQRLTQAEGHILAYLAHHPLSTINDLHRSFGHKRSTLTSLLDRLEGRGWIRRQPYPISRRLVQVELTASGRQVGEQVDAALRDLEQRVMARIGAADAVACLRVIHTLQEEIDREQQHR